MNSKKYWKMINKYLSNECSPEELQEIESLKKKDEEFAKFFNEIMNMLAFDEETPKVTSEHKKWDEIKAEMLNPKRAAIYNIGDYESVSSTSSKKKPLLNLFMRYAAVFLLVTGLPYLSYRVYTSYVSQEASRQFRVIKVAHSERQSITLQDGTNITLDAGSILRIPSDYNKERNVYLSGEAYFKVAHDAEHPFRVYANNALIRVIGTEFNIRAWEEIPRVTVTVKRGEVAFGSSKNKSAQRVFITKGKQSSISKDGIPSVPVKVNINNYTSWMNNELHFKDATLKEILSQLERWYGYHFVVDDSLLYENHLTYHVKKTNVENLLQSISIITKTKVVKEGKTIKLISKNN